MDIRDVVIDAYATVGKGLMLVETAPYYSYVDGKRSDSSEGFKYTVVMPEHRLDRITVKIPGELQLEIEDGDYPVVEFEGLSMRPYWTPNGYQLTVSAESITAV